jgi:hypothetical protein
MRLGKSGRNPLYCVKIRIQNQIRIVMTLKLVYACFIALATIAGAGEAHAAEMAGIVKVVRGQVTVQREPAALPVAVGDRLYAGDRISTAADAAIGITLRDDTLMSLGPKTDFVLEQYRFEQADGSGQIAVRIIKGTLRFVTGLIGKAAPESQRVSTPNATIGIRGTDFIVDVSDE